MIKRILDSRHPVLVYNPPKVFDINYFNSINKAGALPVLDIEFSNEADGISNIEQLTRSNILFGIRVCIKNGRIIDYINKSRIVNLDAVILVYEQIEELKAHIITNTDYKILLEVRDININDRISAVDPDAVILKGNEAPGRVSKFTSYILMQWYLENASFPIIMHGGVGYYTAAGMFAAGAMGVVLDDQLYLTDEAPLSPNFKKIVANMEESDSVVIGSAFGIQYRVFAKLGTKIVKTIREEEYELKGAPGAEAILYERIKESIDSINNPSIDAMQSLFYLGQDGIFAKNFIKNSKKVKDVISSFITNIGEALVALDDHDPLKQNSRLAADHGTKYPVIQGPMANVSDKADFARKLFDEGALPVFAMGNLPPDLAKNILKSGKEKLDTFGAGLIGLAAMKDLYQKHVEILKEIKPKFAVLAAGTPAQASELEAAGIKTYLHTPAMQILENAINTGCRRFIFEGKEAGGHIGLLTSCVLWESAMMKLMSQKDDAILKQFVIFTGGIGTKFGAYFVSGMTSLLARRGASIGIQVGTSYLCTKEILDTGALTGLYQKLILEKDDTVVIGSSMGLSTRTVVTPFAQRMLEKEHAMIKDNVPLDERKEIFESSNIGSLLIAAKGIKPDFDKLKAEKKLEYIHYNEKDQLEKGNFHTGQSLAFYKKQMTIGEVHSVYFHDKKRLIENLNALEVFSSDKHQINDEIAVIGMGCIYPDSPNVEEYWKNIISKKYSIRKVSDARMDSKLHFSEDRKTDDTAYSHIAGEVDFFKFDAAKYGFNEKEDKHMSRSQKILIEAAFQAIADAGYNKDKFPKRRTAVIIGTCLGNELSNDLQMKYYYPEIRYHLDQIEEYKALDDKTKEVFLNEFKNTLSKGYTPKHPDGAALNIEASRISKLLGLEGINYTVDAACATSFSALDNSIKELLSNESDVVITGGVNTNLSPETFVGFCKMGALSNDGSFPFDERANGFVLGEGAGIIILKRLKDAVRDGDKIHIVIKAIGSSSDGKGKAIAAPSPMGQSYAIRRCLENIKTDFSIEDIDFIEAHGTSTIMGDLAEMETLKGIYKTKNRIGISSVKSQIGHLLGGAGAAGFIKAVLAIKNKTLPPNGSFETVAKKHKLDETSFYIIKDPMEWKKENGKPRMAAISSYGFGGINYHIILQEYLKSYKPVDRKIFKDPDYDFNDDRIVAAGLGVVVPGARSIEEFWKNLQVGKNVISQIPDSRFHNDYYANDPDPAYQLPKLKAGVIHEYEIDSLRYKIPPSSTRAIDRGQFFALDAAGQAIEQAGIKGKLINGNRVGVIVGTTAGEKYSEQIIRTRIPKIMEIISGIKALSPDASDAIKEKLTASLKDRYFRNMEDTIPGLLSNIITGRVANFYNCNGPNYIVDAECASSAVALYLAIKELQSKDSDYIIAGGIDANLSAQILMAFNMIKVISPKENRFFDKNASGLVMGEGAALMVLTTYRKARENNMKIIGELSGLSFKTFTDEGLIAPVENGFVDVMEGVYQTAQPNKKQVSYFDVFAASHPLVDKREYQAISRTFRNNMYFGNSKPEISYFRSANPAVVITKLLLMSHYKQIVPNASYNPETSIVETNSILLPNDKVIDMDFKDSVYLAANFSGLGGIHGHAVVRTMPSRFTGVKLAEMREPEPVRQPVAAAREDEKYKRIAAPAQPLVAALLSGQGAQASGMMKELYSSDEAIRSIMDEGNRIFMSARGYSLLDLMFGASDDIHSTENSQPAVFLSSAALFTVLKNKGFRPRYFIGHSIGEYSALYCAGLLNFEEAMKLVIRRGEIMKKATIDVPGSIMVVFKSPDEVKSLIEKSGLDNVYVANKNSLKQTAVSGGAQEIKRLCSFLSGAKVIYRLLNLSGAFHTPYFERASDEMREYLKGVKFNQVDFSRIISNVTGKEYPSDESKVKDLLVKQIKSPVEFMESIEYVYGNGVRKFIELGPNRILVNLLNDINIKNFNAVSAIEPKVGEIISFKRLNDYLKNNSLLEEVTPPSVVYAPRIEDRISENELQISFPDTADAEFRDFVKKNEESLNRILYEKFLAQKRDREIEKYEKFGFYTGKVVVAGTAVGLPGTMNRVFNDDNFEKILSGVNFIEGLSEEDRRSIVDKNITRVSKDPQGNAKFVEITSTDEVIQLAGRLGYFDLRQDYGIDYNYDITYGLAIAAGIEALKDAKIPLVTQYEKTSTGKMIPKGLALPAEMQDRTGIIFSSIISGFETLLSEVDKFQAHKFYTNVYKELESIYYYILEKVNDQAIRQRLTDWLFNIKKAYKKGDDYQFSRDFIGNILSLASGHFAQYIKARGPNSQTNAACASTTQAVGIAEDWIRMGRCDRVIIISGEVASSELMMPWAGSGFLILGAATVKKTVPEAAKPFDSERNGMILGSAAVSIIVEREDTVRQRGLNGQAEVLGTYIGNSGFHITRIDVNHVSTEMKKFLDKVEAMHGLNKKEYADSLLFMSHETYTPARGGSADAEVMALRNCYPDDYKKITITNTKGYTGHTFSAGVEDAVLVKALQLGMAPPIANLTSIPENFANLKFSKGEKGRFEYGMHFAAGFSSHFDVLFIKRISEASIENNPVYKSWLSRISNNPNPELEIINRTLTVKTYEPSQVQAASAAVSAPKALAQKAPEPVKAAAPAVQAPASKPQAQAGAVVAAVKKLIAEQTGYTEDMLEDDLDLEADLGIDTVKQVEIFGKICANFGFEAPEDAKLSELNSISRIAEFVKSKTGITDVPVRAAESRPTGGSVAGKIKKIIAEQTGYTEDMLEDELDLEADLGIDTVKQVEIFSKICASFGFEAPDDAKLSELNSIERISEFVIERTGITDEPAPSATAAFAARPAQAVTAVAAGGGLASEIKSIIAEQTGYTADMLEDDLDLEADLGIDTVKQVEIFSKICSHFGFEVPEDAKLGELNTIARMAEFVAGKTGRSISEAPVQAVTVASQAAAVPSGSIASAIKGIVAEQTGYSVDMLEDTLDLEADLGIDTVKQVEIFSKICANFGFEAPEDAKLGELNTIERMTEFVSSRTGISISAGAAVASVAAAPSGGISEAIRDIISEQTGYTKDMLEEDLDLEADLGIDTVKQVEIFGRICSHFGMEPPEDAKLGELNTIRKMAEYFSAGSGATPPAAPAPSVQPAAVKPQPVQAVSQPASASGLGSIAVEIKKVIAEQTGYSVDMLDENLDLEADLGIDTVKQVEIFSKVCSHFGFEAPDDAKLSELNSIQRLSEFVSSMKSGTVAVAQAATKAPEPAEEAKAEITDSIKRLIIKTKKTDLPKGSVEIFKGRTILITPDKHGFADAVADAIKAQGGKVVLLGGGKADYKIDLAELKILEKTVKTISEEKGDISGFIHLYPLNNFFDGKEIDSEIINSSIKSFYIILKGLYKNLSGDNSIVSAISFNSVIFPHSDKKTVTYPPFAALAGMMKTANKEMKKTLVKIVDFSEKKPLESRDSVVKTYLKELSSGDRRVEAGYAGKDRYVISLAEAAPEKGEPFMKDGDTVLITGGARGITFEILKGIVKKYKIKPVLFGRSDLNIEPEFAGSGVDEKFMLETLKTKMPGAKPLDIKKAVGRVLNQKDTIANIELLRSMGVEPDYHAVDVSNFKALSGVISKYQRIDGVIHAAGLEESIFIEKKDMDSFNRVFDTKINGMLNLLSTLKKIDYRFFVAFSSVTAKFGNEGQIDYTCANDMLAGFLQREKAAHPDRFYKAYDWTAWGEIGMATKESVKKVLLAGGIELLPVKRGVQFFLNDLEDRVTDEIVVTNIIPEFDPDGIFPQAGGIDMNSPFLGKELERSDKSVKFSRVLDLKLDRFFDDHTRDGVPIFLGATGLETMAEAASSIAPKGSVLTGIKDFSIPYGIKLLKGKPKEIIISAVKTGDGSEVACDIISQFMKDGKPMGQPTIHYNGKYIFSEKPLKKEKADIPKYKKIGLKDDLETLIYHPQRLFMEGIFRSIKEILSYDGEALVTRMTNKTGGKFFNSPEKPSFIIDPIIVDGMFQTGGLVDFMTSTEIILPYKISEVKIYSPIEENSEYICITRRTAVGKDTKMFQIDLADEKGNLIMKIKDYEMVIIEKIAQEFIVSDKFEI